MWTDFVKFGAPTSAGAAVEWRPLTADTREWLEVGVTGGLGMVASPAGYRARMAFWDSLFPTSGA